MLAGTPVATIGCQSEIARKHHRTDAPPRDSSHIARASPGPLPSSTSPGHRARGVLSEIASDGALITIRACESTTSRYPSQRECSTVQSSYALARLAGRRRTAAVSAAVAPPPTKPAILSAHTRFTATTGNAPHRSSASAVVRLGPSLPSDRTCSPTRRPPSRPWLISWASAEQCTQAAKFRSRLT